MTDFEEWFPNAPFELKARPGYDPANPGNLTECNALELWSSWWTAHLPSPLAHSVYTELRRRVGRSHVLDDMEAKLCAAVVGAHELLTPPTGPTKDTP